jgi:hypothetical protein
MHRFDVLEGIEGRVDIGLREVRRQRLQDEDAGDARIGVELPERGEHLGELHVGSQMLGYVPVVQLFGEATKVAFYDSAP